MWLESIPDALNKSKNEKLMLLVLLEGNNDESKEMIKSLEDETLKAELDSKTIGLKLIENSDNAKMFHQIYPIKQAPTVYLISHLGILIEVFENKLDKEIFLIKLNQDRSSTNVDKSTIATNSTASDQIDDAQTKEQKRKEILERIEKTKASLKKKRENEDEQKLKNSELERIKSGKELQKLRKQIEEKEQLEAIKQRQKDAEFDRQELIRVKRAIEEQNAEKREKFEKERIEREKEYAEFKRKSEKNSSINRIIKLEENEIKIQFKLPDSKILVNKFKLDDNLQIAVDYLKENCQLNDFRLAISYPKRNFSSSDFGSKFSELGIEKSAVILVIENSTGSKSSNKIVSNNSFIYNGGAFIFSIITSIFAILTGLFSNLFGNGGNVNSTSSTDQQSQNERIRNSRSSNFRGLDRNDDDNNTNTYNGNSTEQQ